MPKPGPGEQIDWSKVGRGGGGRPRAVSPRAVPRPPAAVPGAVSNTAKARAARTTPAATEKQVFRLAARLIHLRNTPGTPSDVQDRIIRTLKTSLAGYGYGETADKKLNVEGRQGLKWAQKYGVPQAELVQVFNQVKPPYKNPSISPTEYLTRPLEAAKGAISGGAPRGDLGALELWNWDLGKAAHQAEQGITGKKHFGGAETLAHLAGASDKEARQRINALPGPLKWVANTAADVAFDPLTYITLGTTAEEQAAARSAAALIAEKTGADTPEILARIESQGLKGLSDAEQAALKEAAPKLTKSVRGGAGGVKFAGHTIPGTEKATALIKGLQSKAAVHTLDAERGPGKAANVISHATSPRAGLRELERAGRVPKGTEAGFDAARARFSSWDTTEKQAFQKLLWADKGLTDAEREQIWRALDVGGAHPPAIESLSPELAARARMMSQVRAEKITTPERQVGLLDPASAPPDMAHLAALKRHADEAAAKVEEARKAAQESPGDALRRLLGEGEYAKDRGPIEWEGGWQPESYRAHKAGEVDPREAAVQEMERRTAERHRLIAESEARRAAPGAASRARTERELRGDFGPAPEELTNEERALARAGEPGSPGIPENAVVIDFFGLPAELRGTPEGMRLGKQILDDADRAGVPLVTEPASLQHARVYRRLGFTERGEGSTLIRQPRPVTGPPLPAGWESQTARDLRDQYLQAMHRARVPDARYMPHYLTPEGAAESGRIIAEKPKVTTGVRGEPIGGPYAGRMSGNRFGRNPETKFTSAADQLTKEGAPKFDTNPARALARRAGESARDVARVKFVDDITALKMTDGSPLVRDWEQGLNPAEWKKVEIPSVATDETGARVVSKTPIPMAVRTEIADDFARIIKVSTDDNALEHALRWMDSYQGVWKAYATVPGPLGAGFMFRNFQTNFFNGYYLTNTAPTWAKRALGVQEKMWAGRRAMADPFALLTDEATKIPGVTQKQLAHELFDNGIIDSGFYEADLHDAFDKTAFGGKNPDRFKPWRQGFAPLEYGRKWNSALEQNARIGVYMAKRAKGFLPQDAASVVRKYLFDYADLSDADRWMKKFSPFWTWIRKNTPLQLEMLAKKPGKYANFYAALQNLDAPHKGQDTPQWMTDAGGVSLPDWANPNNTPSTWIPDTGPSSALKSLEPLLMLANKLRGKPSPEGDLGIAGSTMNALGLGGVAGVVSALNQMASGGQAYSGRPFTPGELVNTPSYLKPLQALGLIGDKIPYEDQFLAEAIMPVLNKIRGLAPTDPHDSAKQGRRITSTLFGQAIWPMDQSIRGGARSEDLRAEEALRKLVSDQGFQIPDSTTRTTRAKTSKSVKAAEQIDWKKLAQQARR